MGDGNPCQALQEFAGTAGCRNCDRLDNPLNHSQAVVLSGLKAHFAVQGIEALPFFLQKSSGIGQLSIAAANRPRVSACHTPSLYLVNLIQLSVNARQSHSYKLTVHFSEPMS